MATPTRRSNARAASHILPAELAPLSRLSFCGVGLATWTPPQGETAQACCRAAARCYGPVVCDRARGAESGARGGGGVGDPVLCVLMAYFAHSLCAVARLVSMGENGVPASSYCRMPLCDVSVANVLLSCMTCPYRWVNMRHSLCEELE